MTRGVRTAKNTLIGFGVFMAFGSVLALFVKPID